MTKPTLANLYRQATRDAAGSALPDADILLALARGERPTDAERIVTEVAQSALQSDLLHFTRALEPASTALATELAAAFSADEFERTVHRRVQPKPARAAAGRWLNLHRMAAAGVAAAMIAGVALWTQQHRSDPGPVAATTAPDRIFAAFDDGAVASKTKPDQIFRGDFLPDEIFNSNGHDG